MALNHKLNFRLKVLKIQRYDKMQSKIILDVQ